MGRQPGPGLSQPDASSVAALVRVACGIAVRCRPSRCVVNGAASPHTARGGAAIADHVLWRVLCAPGVNWCYAQRQSFLSVQTPTAERRQSQKSYSTPNHCSWAATADTYPMERVRTCRALTWPSAATFYRLRLASETPPTSHRVWGSFLLDVRLQWGWSWGMSLGEGSASQEGFGR